MDRVKIITMSLENQETYPRLVPLLLWTSMAVLMPIIYLLILKIVLGVHLLDVVNDFSLLSLAGKEGNELGFLAWLAPIMAVIMAAISYFLVHSRIKISEEPLSNYVFAWTFNEGIILLGFLLCLMEENASYYTPYALIGTLMNIITFPKYKDFKPDFQ